MKTQVKKFTIQLLKELIENNTFINLVSNYGSRDMNVISRYNEGIPQKLLYAIEDNDGKFTILNNSTINTLIFELEVSKNDNKRVRELNRYSLEICIANVENVEEEKLFNYLVN